MSIGRHIIADYYNCREDLLTDVEGLKKIVNKAVEDMGAKVIHCHFHNIEGGITGVAIISESHLSIHSLPKWGFVAVDVFTSGHKIDPEIACKSVEEALHAESVITKYHYRGELF